MRYCRAPAEVGCKIAHVAEVESTAVATQRSNSGAVNLIYCSDDNRKNRSSVEHGVDSPTNGSFCAAGIMGFLDRRRAACCPKECGVCGGQGCSSRPGGKFACCIAVILKTSCACRSANDVGCIIPRSSERELCAKGIVGQRPPAIAALRGPAAVCCDAACGVCGGWGCATRYGASGECCTSKILWSQRFCWFSGDVGCVLPDSRALVLWHSTNSPLFLGAAFFGRQQP
eukprot:6977586-Prymnesium_polylepis.1